eukprot:jgi/Mesen1/3946/ME000209S02951
MEYNMIFVTLVVFLFLANPLSVYSTYCPKRPRTPTFPAGALPNRIPLSPTRGGTGGSGVYEPDVKYNWTAHTYQQTLDHFSFGAKGYQTFEQKYLINDEHWIGPALGGPIFVYFGNEGPIEWFAKNSGFVWETAADFGALLVFPEHRYYGDSLPFGSTEEAYKDAESLAYLSAEQALADMATLLTDLRGNLSAEGCPVVMFGGSYGGTWFRLKYPHIALAALASSAPILQFDDVVPSDTFYNIRESRSCFETIRHSWAVLTDVAASADGLADLTRKFHLCEPLKELAELTEWLESAYSYLAMVDYPVPADFLMPLPSHPIREVCRRMDSLPQGNSTASVLDRVFAGISVYYNYSGQSDNANTSMFAPSDWNLTAYEEFCQQQYGLRPRPHWILTEFGGRNITHTLKIFGSNIIFSNGKLDPWSGGSVLADISDSVVALAIADGAHHLDLRASTLDDPQSVIEQRRKEQAYLRRWLMEFYETRHLSPNWNNSGASVATTLEFTAVFLVLLGIAVLGILVLRSFYHKRCEEIDDDYAYHYGRYKVFHNDV